MNAACTIDEISRWRARCSPNRRMMRPPMNAPKAKHTNVSADVHQTNPCAWASAKPRKTMLPVTFATNTCPKAK